MGVMAETASHWYNKYIALHSVQMEFYCIIVLQTPAVLYQKSSMDPHYMTALNLSKWSIKYHFYLCHLPRILDSSVNVVTIHEAGFEWWQGKEIFLYSKAVTTCLGLTQPSVMNRPMRESDHSPPSSAEVKNEWSPYLYSPFCSYQAVHCVLQQ